VKHAAPVAAEACLLNKFQLACAIAATAMSVIAVMLTWGNPLTVGRQISPHHTWVNLSTL
jgi:hypothetical protein